ncbi:phosphopentomutase DeoB [Thermoclostridium stercorarium subsp. stercorarium DSM 8532]|uniref:Phosphopentomutase n=2 Tax=Thermoclostridium stercorarium TaxID=1510 RepID=L7VUR1_THES1|nr:phosphopentomutase [Thermoclostridium stercorarium]AGC69328.1 phosphopentomutase DeoB [Thermoclostridium stercorarium subsp. stercorarium DSM 8532]AGI40293.1 phosphopentomutase [Thermoclostridium stercorarium subsp. stercorarium DSM 8532]ANW99590.1 phosphopentomutase [Thermoclostridium stercorarium subsp. thermolacticum DSM 2910]
MKRFIVIVLDSAGIGEQPDSINYGDEGSNTIGHISQLVKDFSLPNMEKLGLAFIDGFGETYRTTTDLNKIELSGAYGKMTERSAGKDTTTGHWEIAGIVLDKPFPVFPDGFPEDLMREFERRIGRKTLGNKPASGTVIIQELGDEHVRTGYPIVYTSADSVFQIAAHEGVIPVEELYEICRIARELLTGEYGVGRVIARPFTGESGNYTRTERRKDFSIEPPDKTILNYLAENGYEVRAVGKIEDIFAGSGITKSVHTGSNSEGIERTIEWIKDDFEGMLFTNLVDFDMLYGHRNNVEGYAKALMDFDRRLPEIIGNLRDGDVLVITADHGCDPSTASTDHSREYVPLLITGKHVKKGVNLHTRSSFCDVAKTIAEYFGVENRLGGKSFLELILDV